MRALTTHAGHYDDYQSYVDDQTQYNKEVVDSTCFIDKNKLDVSCVNIDISRWMQRMLVALILSIRQLDKASIVRNNFHFNLQRLWVIEKQQ